MHPFEETKKSPRPGPCEWVTPRSQSLNVSTALGGTEVACDDSRAGRAVLKPCQGPRPRTFPFPSCGSSLVK